MSLLMLNHQAATCDPADRRPQMPEAEAPSQTGFQRTQKMCRPRRLGLPQVRLISAVQRIGGVSTMSTGGM